MQVLEEHSLTEKNIEACVLSFVVRRKNSIPIIGKLFRKDNKEINDIDNIAYYIGNFISELLEQKNLYSNFVALLDLFGYKIKFELKTKDDCIYNLLCQ